MFLLIQRAFCNFLIWLNFATLRKQSCFRNWMHSASDSHKWTEWSLSCIRESIQSRQLPFHIHGGGWLYAAKRNLSGCQMNSLGRTNHYIITTERKHWSKKKTNKQTKTKKQEICTSELNCIHLVRKLNAHRFPWHDVMAAVKLFSCLNAFFCSNKLAQKLARWVKTLYNAI